jgi:hypothetical protein
MKRTGGPWTSAGAASRGVVDVVLNDERPRIDPGNFAPELRQLESSDDGEEDIGLLTALPSLPEAANPGTRDSTRNRSASKI